MLYPYFDQELIELLLRIHPEKLLEDGRAKTPVRRLVKKRLSTVNMAKKKVDFTLDAHDLLRNSGKDVWRCFSRPLKLEEFGYVKSEDLNEYMDAYFLHKHNHWLYVWLIISTETWLHARSF